MRRRRTRRLEVATDLTITSMVDMFTLILTFLLNFVNPADAGSASIVLPTSRATEGVATGVVLSISSTDVRVDGRLLFTLDPADGAPRLPDAADIETLRDTLDGARAAQPSPAPVNGREAEPPTLIVESDRRLPFSLISTLLDGARQAGYTRFRFVVSGAAG